MPQKLNVNVDVKVTREDGSLFSETHQIYSGLDQSQYHDLEGAVLAAIVKLGEENLKAKGKK